MEDRPEAKLKVRNLEAQHTPLAISTMSLFELHHSIERVDKPTERRRRIEAVLDEKPTYHATDPVMKKAGRIYGRLESEGREIGEGDAIIAATALVHEKPVLTRNVDHYNRVEELDIESYSLPSC